MCCCTPPGTSHEYGQAMPILTGCHRVSRRQPSRRLPLPLRACRCRRAPLPMRARLRARRSGSRSADEELLQHVPVFRVLADRLLEDAWRALGHRGDLLLAGRRRPGRGSRRRRARPTRPRRRTSRTPASAPRRSAPPGRPGRPGAAPSRRRSPPRRRCRTGPCRPRWQTSLPARSRWAITPNGCGPPVVGTTSMPRPWRNVEEPLEDRLGLEPLGDGGERAGADQDHPAARLLEVAHVRQRVDDAAAVLQVLQGQVDVLLVHVHAGQDALVRDDLQAEGLQVIARVGAHAPRGTARAAPRRIDVGGTGGGRIRSEDPDEVALEDLHAADPAGARRCRPRT